MKTNETKAKFEAGKTYYGRHICDSDLISRYRVERRTEKFVWVINVDRDGQPYKGESVLRRKVENWTNGEAFMPNGRYSMALSICADDVWAPVFEIKETAANMALAAETYRANVPPVLTVLPPVVASAPARCTGTTWSFVRLGQTCKPAEFLLVHVFEGGRG